MSDEENKKSILNDVNEQGIIFDEQRNILGYVTENGFVYDND